MKYFLTCITLMLAVACLPSNEEQNVKEAVLPQDSLQGVELINYLVTEKAAVDTFRKYNPAATTVWVKGYNSNKMHHVVNRQWPDNIQLIFNVVRDTADHVLLIAEYPFNDAGTWYVEVSHYFDKRGRTYAISRQTNFLNSMCTEGVAYEQVVKYYDPTFKELNYSYLLTDADGKLLEPEQCQYPNPYEFTADTSLTVYGKGARAPLLTEPGENDAESPSMDED